MKQFWTEKQNNGAYIDTHCHFYFSPFWENQNQSLQQALDAGVRKMIVPTVDKTHFLLVEELAKRHSSIYMALGLHPLAVKSANDADLEMLSAHLNAKPEKLIAIGEIGLDKYLTQIDFDKQQYFLYEQLALARQYHLPVILHSRKTHDILLKHLKRAQLPKCGVIHGFSGSFQQGMNFINQGYALGVGGVITYPRAKKTRRAISQFPLDALLLETDAPDMPLYGFQGQPNRPERIHLIWETLCELRTESPEQIMKTLLDNTRRVFNL